MGWGDTSADELVLQVGRPESLDWWNPQFSCEKKAGLKACVCNTHAGQAEADLGLAGKPAVPIL